MVDQLDRLQTLAGLRTVELGVIPFGAALPVVIHNPFWLRDGSLVMVETYSAELALRDPEDVAMYERVFDLLWNVAPLGSEAVNLIRLATAAR